MIENDPIFIVGVPRSGTTVMQARLSSHPRIAIPPETHFLCFWMERYSYLDVGKDNDFDSFWKEFTSSERFSHFGISAEAVLQRIRSKGTRTYKTIFTSVLEAFAAHNGKARMGEKTPAHYDYLEILFNWYPNCSVIWMVRDPRAVCASYQHVPWTTGNVVAPARRWRSSMKQTERWEHDQRIKVVKYEDLVLAPEETLREVCRFLGEDFADVMLNSLQTETARKGWARQNFEAAQRPVNVDSLEKWHSELFRREVKVIEYTCKHYMLKYGYWPLYKGRAIGALWWVVVANTRLVGKLAFSHPREFIQLIKRRLTKSNFTTQVAKEMME